MKKELILPLIIFALTLVFAVICLMVYLSKGNAYWIKRKLKIGALLLTFNGIVYGTSGQGGVYDTCYLRDEPRETKIFLGYMFSTNFISMRNSQLQTDKIKLQTEYISDIDFIGYSGGITYEEHIGKFEESISSIIVNFIYDVKSALHTEALGYELVEDGKGNLVRINKKMNFEYYFSNITLDLLYKQNFIKEIPVGLVGGFYISLPIYSKAKEILVQSVPGSTILELKGEETLFDGDIKEHTRFDFGTKLLIQYELILYQRLYIVPSVGWSYSFTEIVPNSGWTQSSWITNISIRWAF